MPFLFLLIAHLPSLELFSCLLVTFTLFLWIWKSGIFAAVNHRSSVYTSGVWCYVDFLCLHLRWAALLYWEDKLLDFYGNLPALDTFLALCHNPMKGGDGWASSPLITVRKPRMKESEWLVHGHGTSKWPSSTKSPVFWLWIISIVLYNHRNIVCVVFSWVEGKWMTDSRCAI